VAQGPGDQSLARAAARLGKTKQRAITCLTRGATVILDALCSSGRRGLSGRGSFVPRLALDWPTAAGDARQQRAGQVSLCETSPAVAESERLSRAQGNTPSGCRSWGEEVLARSRNGVRGRFVGGRMSAAHPRVASHGPSFPVFGRLDC
jgi:hypothetical protein